MSSVAISQKRLLASFDLHRPDDKSEHQFSPVRMSCAPADVDVGPLPVRLGRLPHLVRSSSSLAVVVAVAVAIASTPPATPTVATVATETTIATPPKPSTLAKSEDEKAVDCLSSGRPECATGPAETTIGRSVVSTETVGPSLALQFAAEQLIEAWSLVGQQDLLAAQADLRELLGRFANLGRQQRLWSQRIWTQLKRYVSASGRHHFLPTRLHSNMPGHIQVGLLGRLLVDAICAKTFSPSSGGPQNQLARKQMRNFPIFAVHDWK
ncbi:unnamed protein product [Protopolystoma xenopodis]|uniref:Uncharacterized protein n=1 Tax=Protopolystoma xenopodis TaxID=117903 RepID=A0A3S5FCX7_9PLAT|nr:unnamed protein product [Protopolystoma xenopodis]